TAAFVASATQVDPGTAVTFDASQSRAPTALTNDVLTKYVWNFGDGSAPQTTTSPQVTHTFQQRGSYTVTLQAYDLQGASGTASVTITVGPVTSATGAGSSAGSGGGANWLLLGLTLLVLALVAVGAYLGLRSQQERNEQIRQRQRAMELARLARARRVSP